MGHRQVLESVNYTQSKPLIAKNLGNQQGAKHSVQHRLTRLKKKTFSYRDQLVLGWRGSPES